jgi:molybdate transport system substrate-binding protein
MSRPRPRWLLLLVAGVVLGAAACSSSSASGPRSITVAAASDLRVAFEELGDRFTDDSGIEVTFSFGSSGQLREQIVNGAPFDVFASANVAFVDAVIEAGRGRADTRAEYGVGRLVLVVPPGGDPPTSLDELVEAGFRRIAIANPDHAPYGLAARQALESVGLLGPLGDRLIYGENISDTLRIVRSGNADVGLVALPLVIADGSPYSLVPDDLHDPLVQALVVTAADSRVADATAFADFVTSPAGREVMVRYGFVLPGEASP